MFRTILSRRRRAETARVDAFVAAIRATAPAGTVRDCAADDTAPLPMSLVRLLVPAAVAAAVLTGCGATPAPSSATPTTAPVNAETMTGPPVEQLTGTDAGLITEPAPTVAELEEADRVAAAAPAVRDPGVGAPAHISDTPPAAPELVQEPELTEPQFPDFGEQYDVVTDCTLTDGTPCPTDGQ
jgi:hypothetical protein